MYALVCMKLCLCMCVCVCVCTNGCQYECMYACIWMYVRVLVCMNACMWVVCSSMLLWVCISVCMNVFVCTLCKYVCLYMLHLCVYVCVFVCKEKSNRILQGSINVINFYIIFIEKLVIWRGRSSNDIKIYLMFDRRKKTGHLHIDFHLLSYSVWSITVKVTQKEEEKACIGRWHFISEKECWQTFIFKWGGLYRKSGRLLVLRQAGICPELWYDLFGQRTRRSVRKINYTHDNMITFHLNWICVW